LIQNFSSCFDLFIDNALQHYFLRTLNSGNKIEDKIGAYFRKGILNLFESRLKPRSKPPGASKWHTLTSAFSRVTTNQDELLIPLPNDAPLLLR
jgi:hypothetical protein